MPRFDIASEFAVNARATLTRRRCVAASTALLSVLLCTSCDQSGAVVAPVLAPQQALKTFKLPPGYSIQLVASEPLVHDPVAVDFDADGRMYVVEMSGFMPNVRGENERVPNGKIVVLEDTDHDGAMDRRTVFLDSLILPRTVTVLERGVLVGAPPFLWLARDTTGDLKADVREVVRDKFGSPDDNPEHSANGALWGMDNWLHAANHTEELRLQRDGSFAARATPSLGQWGVSSDEFGRVFRNSNEDPLRTDLVPAHYTWRSGTTATIRGAYSALTANVPVFPSHKTPAVNRGYREKTLRADSTLAHYTSAGSPTAYIGDRFPSAMRRSVFVTESAGNLVGQFVVADSSGALRSARRAHDSTDFLTSTDERFRPVNLANAPDGTLYVVDMYRGVIQHRTFITDYLEQKIRERGLEQPVGLGRIYRIVYDSAGAGPVPHLSTLTPSQLVGTLTHASGWWRMTAQRLLIERADTSVAPALRALRLSTDDRVRLHALWTLEGLDAVDTASILAGLRDVSPHVRLAALQIAEPWLTRDARIAQAASQRVSDSSLAVRRQLAASLNAFVTAQRSTLASTMLMSDNADAVIADFAARTAAPDAVQLLSRLLARRREGLYNGPAPIEALAAQIARDSVRASIASAIAVAQRAPPELRGAVIAGLARGANERRAPIELSGAPKPLLDMVSGADSALASSARRLVARLHWAGKIIVASNKSRQLTANDSVRIALGRVEFAKTCVACHQANGAGLPGVAGSLVGSANVNGPSARLIRIVLQGKEGAMLMPPVGGSMTDDRIASVLTYIRREWGNTSDPIEAADVKEIRGATTGRKRAWTADELARIK